MTTHRDTTHRDENPDPLSGATGSHPVGTGIGAAGGAASGASIGSVAGPIGAAVGTVVGAVAGALAGKEAAEAIKPTDPATVARRNYDIDAGHAINATAEDEHWRRNYASRPYVTPGASYETYRAAYQYGWESYRRHRGRPFEEVENELRREWERTDRELSWASARGASRDAWQRVDEQRPIGDLGRR